MSLCPHQNESFFEPFQCGVSCPSGSEKIAHSLRQCIEDHWKDKDFITCKLDLRNAFSMVSRQAILEEYANHFPELLPWVSWCYGKHPYLWHQLDILTSEQGVQQGDPLGPLLYALVLQKVVITISKDSCYADLLLHRWYLDDGAIAAFVVVAVRHALHILDEMGPQLGIHINHSKCELLSQNVDFALFPSQMKTSTEPNLVILGVPIGDFQHCSAFISSKRTMAVKLLESIESVGSQDPHVALILLRFCGGFCKLSHIARTTSPALATIRSLPHLTAM